MADTVSDTRSVIKNATQGGIKRPDRLGILKKSSGATGAGNTIATKEEINTQKIDKNLNPKPIKQTSTNTNTATKKTSTKSPIDMVADSFNSVAKKDNGAFIPSNQQNVGTFQNSTIQPIENIKVSQMGGEQTATQGKDTKTQDDNFINGIGRAKDLKTPIDVDNVIGDLYLDVKAKVKNGTLSSSNLEKMKQVYPELAGLGDDVILSLLGDMGSMVKKGLTLNDTNMEKLKKLYPELRSVAWGFVPPEQQNMYQAGGIKEAMVTANPTDLNQYGTVGAIGEGILNPIGEGTTLTDAAAQTIPQVDSNTEFTGTPALKRRLQQLTDKDIEEYYKRYQNFQKEHPTLSKGYTTWLPGDTLVEQLWNWVTGKGEQRADAGFRSWLIDQVNNEVNGWKGEFFGAADELKGVGGPNIAKMYANLPASAVKTVTAISRAITNPVDTGYGLGVLIKDGYENAVNGTFSQSIIGQRYGSWDAFAKAMEQDPVGVASDLLAVAELGAGTAGTVTKAARWGTRGAALTTYAMGVEKTSQNLFKISNRLKQFEGNLKTFGKNVGGASDMGMREVFGKVSGGLEKWAAEGDGFSNKAAKYLANHMTIKPGLNAAKNILNPTKAIAEGITGTKDAEGKLLQAANPNTNRLANDVNYRDKKKNMDTATRAIVEEGYTPKTIEEWANAHLETLNKKWKQFTNLIKEKADVTINASDLVADVKNWLAKEKEGATVNQRGDIVALEKEIADLENRGQLSMEFLENRKEHYNSSWKDAEKTKKGDIYEKGVKMLGNAIRKQQDNILGKGPEETKALRNQIKALMDTKEDVQKASLKQQKRKEGGGLVENYSRISGLGDIIGGAFNTITGKGGEGISQMGKGLGKLVLGKALGKAKDVDFLTEKGFEGLRKKAEAKNKAKGGDNSKKEGVKFKKDTENIKKKAEVDEEQDYADALNAAYRKNKKGERVSTENKEFTISEDSKVYKDIAPKAKNVGFVTRIVDNMKKALEQAGEGDVEGVRAFTDFRQKLINLSKNPGDTTLQHEFFHSVMKVLDPNTRNLILNQAKQFLSAELGRKVGDIAAEEWLAESFGVYIRDKMIDLGIIERAKGIEGLKQRINRFYQRAYEFMQNYNIDRYTLNDVFNEIYNGNYKLNDKGVLDLSYLWKKGGDNGGLGKKRTLGGGNGGGVKFKKDTGATRYKADINGKSVDIDAKATSPDQLIKKNADGLSVMKSFISEKQAKKALNVSKDLLTKDGDAYLWTSTNKNNAQLISDFRNVEDSKYKEFTDAGKEIAWFTNYDVMSKSYAQGKSVLADTKPYKSIADFNKQNSTVDKFKTEGTTKKGTKYSEDKVQTLGAVIKKNGDKYDLVSTARFEHKMPFTLDQLLDEADIAKEGYNWVAGITDENKMHPLTKEERIERLKYQFGGYSNHTYDVELETMPNGNVNVIQSTDRLLKSFDSEKAALAEGKAHLSIKDKYHYQGIMQDMKKPLVVDVKGEGNAPSFWNNIGNAYDLLKKEDAEGLKKLEKAQKKYDETIGKYAEERLALDVKAQRLRQEYSDRFIKYETDKPLRDMAPDEREKAIKEIERLNTDKEWAFNAKYQLVDMLWGKIDDLHSGVDTWVAEHKDFYKLYEDIKKFTAENKDMAEFMKNLNKDGALEWLGKNGVDDATLSLFHKALWGLNKDRLQDFSFITALKRKELQTNDYVFWALRKGNYDGVLFKNIIDYGDTPVGGWENAKGGDVVAAFNSKQFKAWDNANPTDSKYISYKKDAGLKAKNGYKIDENAKTPEQLVKDVNGASEMVSFISEKQAKMAHDVSKDLLSKDGNPYMWMHTNKYNDKMFSDFKATRDSKYSLYTSKDIAWFSNSNNITQSYAEGKSKLAPTKKFNSIEEFNKYADKNVLDDGWKIQRYGDEKEITKSQIAEWNGKYVPHTISTYENKFDTLADAYAHFNDDGLMKNRGISTKIGELPADPKEAVAKLEKYIKAREGGDIKIKGNAEKLSSKIDIETKFDNYNTLGYFDNKNDALAEAYQKATPSDYYTYKGIITNMKKPYVVDYSDYKFGKYWNKLGTLTDFAKREGGDKIAKAIDYVNHYDNLKYDLIDFLENGKKDLLGDDGKYIEGNMIEDKDYFLTNIIRNIREGTVDTLLSDGAWKGDEFASIKDDIVHGTKTYGDLYDMLQHLKGNTGLGFMEDYGTLPEVLDKLGVSEGVKNTLIQKLIDREYFDGAPLSYGDRIEIKGIRDLMKKLGGINLETNDYVKYAINNGDYDGVVFKNIIDYGGTPKEGWDKAEPGDVAVTFNSKQFKSWDNADPTESRYISYKKDTKGLGKKQDTDSGLRYKRAYHGSPADFDRFDSSHMGEGEGAQAHGWGHYVAVEERTGRHYAGMGGEPKNEVTYKGRTILEHSLEEAKAERGKMAIMGKMDEGKSFEDAKKFVLDEYKGYVKRWKEMLKNGNWDKVWWDEEKLQKAIKEGEHIIETAEDAKKSDFKVETRTKRNLYELEIPDPVKRDTPTGSNYLEEEGKITRPQLDKIVKALESYIPEKEIEKGADLPFSKEVTQGLATARQRYAMRQLKEWGLSGEETYKALSTVLGGDKQASKFLESLGYDGIHYYGGRDGEAYVLFNDDAPQIQNHIRYKKDVNSEGKKLSEGQIKHFEYSKARNDKGELIPVYRGTKNIEGDFFKWSEDHQTGDNYGKAFYFTTNKHQAEGYAHITDKDPRWIKYDTEHKGLLKKFKETRSNEDMEAFLNHGKDYDVWGDMDNNPSKYPEAMGEVKEYYLNIENPLEYDAKGERYFRVYDNLFKQARDNGNDGIIIKNVIDNSVTKDGKGEIMDVFVTFNENQAKYTDNLNPTSSDNKRFKKDTSGLAKRDNGLQKKEDIRKYTQKDIDKIYNNWMGGRKQAKKAMEKFANMKALVQLNGDEFGKVTDDEAKLTNKVIDYYKSKYGQGINSRVERDNFGTVILGNKAVRSSFFHTGKKTREWIAAYKSVPDIIMKGDYLTEVTNRKGDGYDYTVFGAPIEIGGERYICTVSVRKKAGDKDHYYYLHEVGLEKELK